MLYTPDDGPIDTLGNPLDRVRSETRHGSEVSGGEVLQATVQPVVVVLSRPPAAEVEADVLPVGPCVQADRGELSARISLYYDGAGSSTMIPVSTAATSSPQG